MNSSSKLQVSSNWNRAVWAMAAAFGAYFCMYGFRKPFTAATSENFGNLLLWGIDYKILIVTTQVLGYLLAKFIGIKVISEMPQQRRALSILGMIAIAQLSLVIFGLIPAPWNFPLMFINGLMLGMVFGLVMSFLEGRQVSELLIAGLCSSFILADGVMKTVGTRVLQAGVSAYWMPAVAGTIFILPLLISVWMLTRIPPPSDDDRNHRSNREPMSKHDRREFFARYGMGLWLIVGVYVLTTILRSVRADFAPEIWKSIGYSKAPDVFTTSEMYVALGIMLVNGLGILIKTNRTAFFNSLGVSGFGFLLVILGWIAYRSHFIGGFPLMVMLGLGLYLPYVAIHTTVFERLIAWTRQRGNLGFLMYFADTMGYAAYVLVLLGKGLITSKDRVSELFPTLCIIVALLSIVCLVAAGLYFRFKTIHTRAEQVAN
ncbi:MAG: DUF5690 family protein [Zavarzinella sp.]